VTAPEPERPCRPNRRLRAAFAALGARLEARRARRDEQSGLLLLGEALAGTPSRGADALCAERGEVAELEAAVRLAKAAVAGSLEDDRADYALVSPRMRVFVIVRGVAARLVWRDRLKRAQGERAAACRRLGAAALARGLELPADLDARAALARDARVRAATAHGQAEVLLAPFGGSVLPRPVHHLGREVTAFARPLAREVRGQLLPRVPALAGLVVGWWVARTFTDSHFWATLHSLGIGSGPRRAVSGGTLRALGFWLPVLAAALCSYLGNRLGTLVRARYAPKASEDGPDRRTGPASGEREVPGETAP